MNRRATFVPIAAALCLALLPTACRTQGGSPDANPPDQQGRSATGADGDVLRATLDNGLRVVIVRNTLAPTVAIRMTYLAGGYETPAGFPGTAHALEHMMFRDSSGLSGSQLDELTAKMGGDSNAFTTNDATQYMFFVPAAYLDVVLHVEALRMRGALLTEKDWKLEKGAIEQEVSADISDPGFLAFQKAERILYAGTGYAEDPLGTRPSFDQTTSATLRRFYDEWYQPGNAVLVVVGDVDPRAALATVRSLFGSIPSTPTPERKPVVLQPVQPTTIERTTPSATGSLQLLYRLPGLMSDDAPALQILFDVLDNPRSGLSDLAARGVVLSADAQIDPYSHGGIGVLEVGFPRGGDVDAAQRALDGVIDSLLEKGVPSELVEAAQRSERADFEFARNSASTLAGAWAHALAWQGLDSPQAAEDRIQAVTVEDVNRVARTWLHPDGRVTIVLTPAAEGARPPESAGFGGTESFAGGHDLDVALPEWAAGPLQKLEMPHWTLDPTPMMLPNGLTLVVQPEHVSHTVTVMGHIDHEAGMQEPPGQEGVGRLLSSLFDYGTTTLDRADFHRELDAIAATESGGQDFSLEVLSDGFDRGMQLLADNELHPALPPEAFQTQKKTLVETLAGQLKTPGYKMMRALREGLLPPGDPDLREATPETVGSLQLADVKSYFTATFRPDLTTIVVVGDVTPEQARAIVERWFGGWTAEGPRPDVVPPRVPLNPSGYTVVSDPFASQDEVVMGQMLDLDLYDPDRYALELGNDVLGGAGFASRLLSDIRVRHGYAYSAGSGMHFDRSRSTFYVEYGSDPDKVAAVDALVQENIATMRSEPVQEAELANARQYEIRSIPLSVGSVDRIAGGLLSWTSRKEPLDQPMVAARHFLALSAADVQKAFERYLEPRHLVQVVLGPTPTAH